MARAAAPSSASARASVAETLCIGDFSPEWDEAAGGGKMLLAAETSEGCLYSVSFGGVIVPATLVRPHVLRVRVPSASDAAPERLPHGQPHAAVREHAVPAHALAPFVSNASATASRQTPCSSSAAALTSEAWAQTAAFDAIAVSAPVATASSACASLAVPLRLMQFAPSGELLATSPASSFTYRLQTRLPKIVKRESSSNEAYDAISISRDVRATPLSCSSCCSARRDQADTNALNLLDAPAPKSQGCYSGTARLASSASMVSTGSSKCCRLSEPASCSESMRSLSPPSVSRSPRSAASSEADVAVRLSAAMLEEFGGASCAGSCEYDEMPDEIEHEIQAEAEAMGSEDGDLPHEVDSEVFAMALSLSSDAQLRDLEAHFRALLLSLGEPDARRQGSADDDADDAAGAHTYSSEGLDELENEECADMDSEANAYSAVGSQASTIYNTIGTHGTTDTTEHGHSSTRNSTNSLSCADHVSSTQHVSSVPSAARAGRDSFASLHLPRLQRAVRERLQREPISKARRHTSRLPPSSRLSLPPNLGASTAHDLISRVQRRFRRRLDSQRHAALAIERFYMRQRQRQAKAAADKKRLATLPSHDEESHSHNHHHQQQHELCHPHEHHDQFLLEQQQQQQTPHEQQHLPHQRHRPHSQPRRGLLPSQSERERARPRPSLLQAQFAQRPASPRGEAVIRSAQANFRARQHRKHAVQVIERAYGEWKYHAEQARLAAEGSIARGADAALHTYHSQRRERAARCIQGYLQRQESQQRGSRAPLDEMSDEFEIRRAVNEPGDETYTEEQLGYIRRAQRAFRAHVRQQAEEARALHAATRSTSAMGDAEHFCLCEILRRAAAGARLSTDEQMRLARLQQAFRDSLERKRRAAGIISSAFRRSAPAASISSEVNWDAASMSEPTQGAEPGAAHACAMDATASSKSPLFPTVSIEPSIR